MGKPLPTRLDDYLVMGLSGVLVLVVASVTVTWAQQWVPSGVSAVIMASSAVWLTVFGALGKRGERPTVLQWFSLFLGLVGLLVVLSRGRSDPIAMPIGPALAVLGAAMSMALGTLLMRRRPINCHPVMAAGIQSCVAGGLLVLVCTASWDDLHWHWSTSLFMEVAYLSIFGSGIAYVLYCWLATQVAPSKLSSVVYVSPAVAVLIGFAFLGEVLSPLQWLGIGAILLATLLLTRD
ncbi:hypothetical protein GCM10027567_04490 [Spongiibacter taiwanensis]